MNMNHAFTRKLGLILLALPLTMVLFLYLDIFLSIASYRSGDLWKLANNRPFDFMDRMQIYVVSLPYRRSRYADMETLRAALGLHWHYYDAMSSENPLVGQILDWIQRDRSLKAFSDVPADNSKLPDALFWPGDIEDIAYSGQEIPLLSSPVWELPTSLPPYQPLTCNEKNDITPDFSPGEAPKHKVLTPARVACWHSHVSIIHQHANSLTSAGSVALILEDDVDMEKDIVAQMKSLWSELPEDWDIVFLGHCWSDETHGRLLSQNWPDMENTSYSRSRVYASTSPKCTHAYAVSKIGARRLLLHLAHPPFAYSRAIDQALAWLVESGRIKSFSVVPSLVVQRKISSSDVLLGGTNSQWKDTLVDGVLSALMPGPQ